MHARSPAHTPPSTIPGPFVVTQALFYIIFKSLVPKERFQVARFVCHKFPARQGRSFLPCSPRFQKVKHFTIINWLERRLPTHANYIPVLEAHVVLRSLAISSLYHAAFHLEGNVPVQIERLNMWVSGILIGLLHSLRRWLQILSFPQAFQTFFFQFRFDFLHT